MRNFPALLWFLCVCCLLAVGEAAYVKWVSLEIPQEVSVLSLVTTTFSFTSLFLWACRSGRSLEGIGWVNHFFCFRCVQKYQCEALTHGCIIS